MKDVKLDPFWTFFFILSMDYIRAFTTLNRLLLWFSNSLKYKSVDWSVSGTKCGGLSGGIFLIIVDLWRICCSSVRD